jgi:hypothetical protein
MLRVSAMLRVSCGMLTCSGVTAMPTRDTRVKKYELIHDLTIDDLSLRPCTCPAMLGVFSTRDALACTAMLGCAAMLRSEIQERDDKMKKYELVSDLTTDANGKTLYRIRALTSFSDVKAGDLGGWIEKEDCLSQFGDAWVYDDAEVGGDARVSGDARVFYVVLCHADLIW